MNYFKAGNGEGGESKTVQCTEGESPFTKKEEKKKKNSGFHSSEKNVELRVLLAPKTR